MHDASGAAAPGSTRCPLCAAATDRRVLARHDHLEHRVAHRLSREHADWHRSKGACLRCVAWAQKENEREEEERFTAKPAAPGRGGDILAIGSRLRCDPSASGRGVTVAVVDSDFVFHPEFLRPRSRVVVYSDCSSSKARTGTTPPEPYIGSWHGTMVAGAGFGSGFVAHGRYPGLAPHAHLVLVRIADRTMRVGEVQVLRGLQWVLAHRERYDIRVVNLSVGGDEPMHSRRNRLDRLAARAVRAGMTLVAAAGNRPDRKPVAPASAPEVITVGGVNDFGRAHGSETELFGYSSGPTLDGVQKPDVLAPAIWVPAPMVPGTPQTREAELLFDLESLPDELLLRVLERRIGETKIPVEILELPPEQIRGALALRRASEKFLTAWHQHVDGTSFAAAVVSAVAAQMLEVNPKLSPEEVKGILRATARPLPDIPEEKQGAGVVQPDLAVRLARELTGADPHRVPPRSPEISAETVKYRFFDPSRRLTGVDWVGALSGWKPMPMHRAAPGVWELERPRPMAGRYAYKYLLSDGRWWDDPLHTEREPDGMGGWNSVLTVGSRRAMAP